MYDTENSCEHLLGKSPECIYYSFQYGHSAYSEKSVNQTKPWFLKLKEWLFPSLQAYPLPPFSTNPKKYY